MWPAQTAREANAIVAHVENAAGAAFVVVVPYEKASSGDWSYLPGWFSRTPQRVFGV